MISDFKERMLSRLLTVFSAQIWKDLLIVISTQIQEAENAVNDFANFSTVYVPGVGIVGGGVYLRSSGLRVGVPYTSDDDDEYRDFYAAQIKVNNSHCSIPELISICESLTGGNVTEYRGAEYYGSPCQSFVVEDDAGNTQVLGTVTETLQRSCKGGTQIGQVVQRTNNSFRFDTASRGWESPLASRI